MVQFSDLTSKWLKLTLEGWAHIGLISREESECALKLQLTAFQSGVEELNKRAKLTGRVRGPQDLVAARTDLLECAARLGLDLYRDLYGCAIRAQSRTLEEFQAQAGRMRTDLANAAAAAGRLAPGSEHMLTALQTAIDLNSAGFETLSKAARQFGEMVHSTSSASEAALSTAKPATQAA